MSRSHALAFFFLSSWVASLGAQEPAKTDETEARAVAAQVAEAYGLSAWQQLEALEYTFNVHAGERRIARSWAWYPTQDRVEMKQEDGSILEFSASTPQNADSELREAHGRFINDQYWLLFPFHLLWDDGLSLRLTQQPHPLDPEQTVQVLTAQYGSEGGYTPGDAYDLFLDEQFHVLAWAFRRGGGQDGRVMTWEAPIVAGPFRFSVDHKSPDGAFRLWFSNVRLRLQGSEQWIAVEQTSAP